jgi:hypothetical protein
MKKTLLFIFTLLTVSINAQNVFIPDTNFKNYLLSTLAVNSNMDTAIQVSEANAFNGILNIDNKNISDLTGIEAFINMKELRCFNNQITTLDMSNSPNLTLLSCGSNQLTSINVANNPLLKTLSTPNNNLTTINVTNNDSLVTLGIDNNSLSTINLSNNLKLYWFYASNNNITTLDLSNNILLNQIRFEKNLITSLNLTNNPNLQGVWLDSNSNLVSLNIKNGNNTNIFGPSFIGNPSLSCIQVDDSSYSASNWTNIDAQHFFSENCSVGVDEISDDYGFNVYPNPATTVLTVNLDESFLKKPTQLKIIGIDGRTIKTLILKTTVNTININELPKGFYTLTLHNNDKLIGTKKIILTN